MTDDEQALTRTIGQRLRALRQGRELLQPLDKDECELVQAFRNTDQRGRDAILSMVEQQGQEP